MSNELVWSIKNGDLEEVQNIIEKEHIDVNKMISGRMPIHYAADFGQTEIIKYLLSLGARVDEVDSHGITALLAAIWEGHTECVKLLIQSGADVHGKTPAGISYIEAADKDDVKTLLI